jgi:hypothetical protein
MRNYQSGATLIIVLVLLVAITIVGTLAIRQSQVGLNIATNSQAQQLMLQNSDAAFFNVEQEDNIIQSLSSSGMFGYIDGAANKDKELVFCYRGVLPKDNSTLKTPFFDISRASIMAWNAPDKSPKNNSLGTDGYCSTSTVSENFFTSGRKAVMTQVAVKFSTEAQNDPFYGQILGTDDNTVKLQRSKPVKVFAVSIMPGLTTVESSKIDTCFSSHMNDPTIPDGVSPEGDSEDSVTRCLEKLSVPFQSSVTEYVIAQDFV